jgi:DNA helicase-4
MARTNDILNRVRGVVDVRNGMDFFTYHRSKGLQAEVAILIEDCIYDQVHKLRNRIYSVSGLFSKDYTYDQAMSDEMFRLGYVAATRGRRRVFWFVDEAKGAAKQLCDAGTVRRYTLEEIETEGLRASRSANA